MKQRERRRDRTHRAAARAQREHMLLVHAGGKPDCICEQSPLYFSKRKSLGCDCRGRKAGQPKLGTGVCHGFGGYRPAVKQRQAWRREAHRWLRWRGAPDDRFDRGEA